MASTKRKEVNASHNGDKMAKKLKTEDDGLDSQTLQSKAGKFQGLDDESIEALFEAVFHAINNLALTSFRGAPYIIPRASQHKGYFASLTSSDYKPYLKSKTGGAKQEIVKAAVWNQLIERLLSAPTKAFLDLEEARVKNWAWASGKSPIERQRRVSNMGQCSKADFYAWRCVTARFLSDSSTESGGAWSEQGEQRQDFITKTADLLLEHSVDGDRERLESQLDSIADKAFQLAQAMACCRAGWCCTRNDQRTIKSYGFNFKAEDMEKVELWDENEEYSKIVDLVAVPMLLKRGNNRGEDFGTLSVIKKAQVVMKRKTGAH